ncbi:hypothetical protein BV20DRAFT_970473 [Pilatotrama ljubarskyi]|nr:hypothetical protein BV20DRAFT_970473 [Pilatotrama ljubarskyi]
MTATTMHFGPEWMRTKQGSARPAPSPPLTASPAPPGGSTYSALVTPATHPPPEGRDDAHPFRYSKEEMLRIYKEGGGRGGLGLEVERWEGIVREIGYEPVGLKEMSEAEKKLFAGPLNSEVRRRQSTDFLSPLNTTGLGERPKLAHASSGTGSPMRERIGSFMGRRRDSTDQAPLTIPRKLSLSNMQGGLASPRDGALPSPRVRVGLTPGFDGVLSETWSARRRNADKSGNSLNKGDKEGEGDTKGPDLKEEDELHAQEGKTGGPGGGTSSEAKHPNGSSNPNATSVNQVNGQLEQLSINGQGDNQPSAAGNPNKPPGLGDLSSVEWSYLDPQGNVQGPFPADLMQRWYNEGYFTSDLLMKRTHLDTEWTPVGVLKRRAGDQPLFLTPLVHAPTPPGLNPRLDTVVDSGTPDRNQHSPYQPVPTRTLRSSTLDSYLTNGTTVPESPSSSFGGRFVNGSPDPSLLDNRLGGQIGFSQGTESRMPFASGPGQRRATLNESMDPMFGNRGFGGLSAGRTPGVDGIGFGGGDNPSVFNDVVSSPFGARSIPDPSALNGQAGQAAPNGTDLGPIGGIHSNQGTPSRVLNRDAFGKPVDDMHGGSFSNGSSPFISNAQAFSQTPLSHFAGQDNRSLHSMTPISDRQSISSLPFSHQLQQPFVQSPGFTNSQSPWLAGEGAPFRRPGPFDANHPTSSNTFVAQPLVHSPSFGRTVQSGLPTDQSPWQTPAQPVNHDPWRTSSSNNLTVANLGQHDAQQRQAEIQQQQQSTQATPPPAQSEAPAVPTEEPQAQATTPPVAAPAATSPPEPAAPQKTRRRSGAQAAQAAPKVTPAPAPKPPSPAPAPAPATEPKVAPWAVDDEKKARTPGGTLNLREIQEAEAKKAEARKAAERERERAARAAASAQAEEFQPFTASWGLSTSQAGAAARANNGVKETPAASPFAATSPTPATPVWTNATKAPVAKKTMKEIQEEEERRKKLAAAKEKETMATAARRGYAETTTKPVSPAQQTGGAWTTVGAGGKASAATIAAARPAVAPAASTKSVPTVAAASPAPAARPTATVTPRPAAVALKSTASKEESAVAPGPSLEFLKWLGDSLKGLNSSVNLEEITSMLLSFPLDPDQTTMEIISDLIYASSTTLDGRRFAAEFVSKRKADATSRPKGANAGSSSAKPLSIADVVKAQPKPAQSEWGFKVVNKKKKGGRA